MPRSLLKRRVPVFIPEITPDSAPNAVDMVTKPFDITRTLFVPARHQRIFEERMLAQEGYNWQERFRYSYTKNGRKYSMLLSLPTQNSIVN